MGRFRIGVGLLAVLLAVSIAAQIGIALANKPVTQALEQGLEFSLQEDFPSAHAAVIRAQTHWHRFRGILAALADHQHLEDIDCQLAALTIWAEEGERGDFAALCADTLLRIQAVSDAHRLTLASFF